jgi:hypothetical protein
MSEKKRGGLDYTPRAFPGARDPDGPAPDLEDQLAKLGLVDRAEAEESRADTRNDVNPGVSPGNKKRSALEYTPQAFPGARAPDGPAPDLQDRLAKIGLAERSESRDVRPDARHDTSYAPPQPSARRERPVSPPSAAPFSPSPAAQRERVAAPSQGVQLGLPVDRPSPAPSATPRERVAAPGSPAQSSFTYGPPPAAPRERVAVSSQPISPSPPRAEPLRRTERIAPQPIPGAQQASTEPSQPAYAVLPPASAAVASNTATPPLTLKATPPLSPVPPEAAPRPIPVASALSAPASVRDLGAAHKPVSKPSTRAASSLERVKKLPNKETRVRLSARLIASVDEKLNDLAHLRGLDRNTAVSVAIVQDWVQCFGLQAKQATR